jgi:hypothetical protein
LVSRELRLPYVPLRLLSSEKLWSLISSLSSALQPESEKTEIRKGAESIASAASTVGSGIVDSTSNLVSSGLSNAQTAISENYGKEAREVADQSGNIVKDAGIAGMDATMATSMMGHGYEAGMGAMGRETQSGESA